MFSSHFNANPIEMLHLGPLTRITLLDKYFLFLFSLLGEVIHTGILIGRLSRCLACVMFLITFSALTRHPWAGNEASFNNLHSTNQAKKKRKKETGMESSVDTLKTRSAESVLY